MSDNVPITPGSGATISTDEVGGIQVQRVKVQVGADGSATDVSEAAPLPVNDAGGSLTVDSTSLGTTAEAEAAGNGGIVGILKRLRTLLAGGLPAALSAGGFLKVAVEAALPAGTNSIGKIKSVEEALPAGTNSIGTVVLGAGTAEAGKVKVTELPALPTGSNAIGKLAEGTAKIGKVELEPRTSGGIEVKRVLSAASTNATSVKASAGQVYGFAIFNTSAAVRYVKLYNKASAPTVGTDTPVMTLMIPKEGGVVESDAMGIVFGTGIALATTKGVADANTEAVAENDLIINLYWK